MFRYLTRFLVARLVWMIVRRGILVLLLAGGAGGILSDAARPAVPPAAQHVHIASAQR